MRLVTLFAVPVLALLSAVPAHASVWLPLRPGPAEAKISGNTFTLRNKAIEVSWKLEGVRLDIKALANGFTGERVDASAPAFASFGRQGAQMWSQPLKGKVSTHRLAGRPNASKASERVGGRDLAATFVDPQSGLVVKWRAILVDDANYVRQELTFSAPTKDVDLSEIATTMARLPYGQKVGATPGSPFVAGNFFVSAEHPMADVRTESAGTLALCTIKRGHAIRKGQSVTYSAVIGVVPKGQLRRGFLNYVEMERAHPYRPFLHYNSWYDLGYFTQFDEKQCVERINAFGEELVRKRGVKLSSFLFDDGWDKYESVWEFHKGFPNGFLPLRDAAQKYGAGPGVWLSPWGGYGGPRQKRLAFGKAHGMEVDSQGYALSGPRYYQRFHEVTTDFVTRQGINQFKFDGTGSPDKTTPGSAFDSDFDAAISLISDLRKSRPDLFVNLTTGTWPSPFWLRYADSTWRGGSDHAFNGVGPKREQWITYRDGDTYRGVVQRGPLYPINSLMLHGIIYAQHAHDLNTDPDDCFRHEVQSYFGTGTQLQEMYITPTLLTPKNWDDLASMARFAAENADVMVDTHWVGGDPSKLEVYGWASWNGKKAILTLRNPSDQPQAFSIDPRLVFELPESEARDVELSSPWKDGQASLSIPKGQSRVIVLQPFEVITREVVR